MALSSSMYFLILQTYKPYTATRFFFVPIIAITPFEQVLAEPDFEFLVRLHRQRGRKIIKEQL